MHFQVNRTLYVCPIYALSVKWFSLSLLRSLILTALLGEMSHHEILDAVARGITVIVCEHSNTERGFLAELQQVLAVHLENKIRIIVSERDRDPLQVA